MVTTRSRRNANQHDLDVVQGQGKADEQFEKDEGCTRVSPSRTNGLEPGRAAPHTSRGFSTRQTASSQVRARQRRRQSQSPSRTRTPRTERRKRLPRQANTTASSHSSPSSSPSSARPRLPPSALEVLHKILSPLPSSSTACPSQLARALYTREADWRDAMPAVRDLVWACARRGWVEVTQKGQVRAYEDREGMRGPIRVRKGEKWGEFDVRADMGDLNVEHGDVEGG